jgi:hypothetical protein
LSDKERTPPLAFDHAASDVVVQGGRGSLRDREGEMASVSPAPARVTTAR